MNMILRISPFKFTTNQTNFQSSYANEYTFCFSLITLWSVIYTVDVDLLRVVERANIVAHENRVWLNTTP